MISLFYAEENPSFYQLLKQFIQYWTHKETRFVGFFQQHYANHPGKEKLAYNTLFLIIQHGQEALDTSSMEILTQTCLLRGI